MKTALGSPQCQWDIITSMRISLPCCDTVDLEKFEPRKWINKTSSPSSQFPETASVLPDEVQDHILHLHLSVTTCGQLIICQPQWFLGAVNDMNRGRGYCIVVPANQLEHDFLYIDYIYIIYLYGGYIYIYIHIVYIYTYIHIVYKYIYIYVYTRIYIWSRVKIVYGTFRGVPDVWNEGAS